MKAKITREIDSKILYTIVVIVIVVAVILGWSVITPEGRWRWGCSVAFLVSGKMPSGCEVTPARISNLAVRALTDSRNVRATVAIGLGDVNWDGIVDITDVNLVYNAFGSSSGSSDWNPDADLNNDEKVNILDAAIISANWEKIIPIYTSPFTINLNAGSYTLRAKYGAQIQNKNVNVVEDVLTTVDLLF